MLDTTLLLNKLKELQKLETESVPVHALYGRIREIEIVPVHAKYDDMVRNVYDDELRTFFYFPITDAISEEYNELLDDYIDMMDLLIHNFSEKHTPN